MPHLNFSFMDSEVTYQINKERILLSQIGDEGVVFDLENNEYKVLNETLYKIVNGLQEGRTLSEICESLVKEYNIAPDECLKKIEKAVATLIENEYILPV
jgi:hypothetical protein